MVVEVVNFEDVNLYCLIVEELIKLDELVDFLIVKFQLLFLELEVYDENNGNVIVF